MTSLGALGANDSRAAIVEPGRGSVTYAELDRLADAVAARLKALGIVRGARVGLYVRRSSDAIAAMLGTLRAGCTYVPVDPQAPVARIAEIHADCRVQTAFVEDRFENVYRNALARNAGTAIGLQPLAPVGAGHAIEGWAVDGKGANAIEGRDDGNLRPDLACLLVHLWDHGPAERVDDEPDGDRSPRGWCHRFLAPTRDDVFANHAQFSFGMSLFDIYSSLGRGSTLVLVPDDIRQHGSFVADLMARERVSIWFSGPAILSLIAQLSDLEARDLTRLRVIAFAGEVFPLQKLNALRRRLPRPRYFNFYGSTEANVAACYELPSGRDLDDRPPIGRPCEHYEARIVSEGGGIAAPGSPGELQLRGGGLGAGYWNLPASDSTAPPTDGGGPWFRTNDLAVELPDGDLRYAGRIGRMVKLRGYRVEPGEIEARLYQHAAIKEVGVVPVDGDAGLELIAHVSTATGQRLPVSALKEFCAMTLPAYMIPARFEFHASLPKTSSGKIDLQSLRATAATASPATAPAESETSA